MKMRSPVRTEKGLREEAAFAAVKTETGLKTILDSGFKEMHLKFLSVYKDGMTPEQTIAAYKAEK